MRLLAHLVITSSELLDVNESAMNQVNADVTSPHQCARDDSTEKNEYPMLVGVPKSVRRTFAPGS